jgi:hypothetical protein
VKDACARRSRSFSEVSALVSHLCYNSKRYRLVAAVLYVIWAAYSSDEVIPEWIWIALIFVAPFVVGFAVGRLWAVLLPGIGVLLSVPAGYGVGESELPVWFGMMFVGMIAVPAILIGRGARWLAGRYVSRSGKAHERRALTNP